MPYIICNNDNYLVQATNGFSIVHDMKDASKWQKIDKANNVCKNVNQNKKLYKYHMEVKYVSQENKVVSPPAKPIELDYDILDRIKEISEFTKKIISYRNDTYSRP